MTPKPGIVRGYVNIVRYSANFRNLWYAQIVSQLGDWFSLIATAALVVQFTESGLALGGLFVARTLPQFAFSPIVGIIVDRFDRRKILIASDLARAVLILGMLLVRDTDQAWLLYILTAFLFAISALWIPTANTMLPEIVGEDEVVTANAMLASTFSTMFALGAAAGGLVAGVLGIYPAFVIDSGTFLVSAYFTWRITYQKKSTLSSGGLLTGVQQYIDGLRFLRQHVNILSVTLVKAVLSFVVAGGSQVVVLAYAEQLFPLGKGAGLSLGLMYAAFGIGTGVGPFVARAIVGDNPPAMRWTIAASFVMAALGMLIIGVAPVFAVVLLGMLLRGFGGATVWVFSTSLLLILVPEKVRGRTFAFEFAAFTLATAAGSVVAGSILDVASIGPRELALILSATALLGAIPWTLWLLRSGRANLALDSAQATPSTEFASD